MDETIAKILKENQKIKIKDNYYLTNKQITTLANKNIPYNNLNNSKELLFILQEFLDDEEIDEIALEISEDTYYNYTNK